MKQRIHMRIFLPVLGVLFIFPIAVFGGLTLTADWYSRNMASRQVQAVLAQAASETETIQESLKGKELTAEESRTYYRDLVTEVKSIVKEEKMRAELLIFNGKLKLLYPGTKQREEFQDRLYETALFLYGTGDLGPEKDAVAEIDGRRYLIGMFEAEKTPDIRARYLIGYGEIPDLSMLLSYAGGLVAAVTFLCLGCSAVAVWQVSRSIARPLESFCSRTAMVGQGLREPILTSYSIKELEKLRESFNEMAKELKEAEERNQRFFQNVSHDLRTPLVSIGGYAQGIQCGIMKDHEKAAGIILSESKRMAELVESILTISSMDTGERKLNKSVVELGEFVKEQAEVLKGMPGGEKIQIGRLKERLSAEADRELLIRIFQNVVSNGVKYAETSVTIELTSEKAFGVITVEDDGPGIAAEDLDHVFERFYKGKNGNFGIGLSVVKTGMEYLGGRVTAENQRLPRHGARYRLYLPLNRERVLPAAAKPIG